MNKGNSRSLCVCVFCMYSSKSVHHVESIVIARLFVGSLEETGFGLLHSNTGFS